MKAQQGLTLIELLVTMVIVGVIAGIAIPAYTGYIATARMSEAHNNVAALKLAEEEFFLENNRYFSGADAATLTSNSGNLWTVSFDSSNGAPLFNYNVSGTTTSYTITATGKANTAVAGKTVTASK